MENTLSKNIKLADFLVGEWTQCGVGIQVSGVVESESYNERFSVKDSKTILVEHDCFGDWQSAEMGFEELDDEVIMTQGDLIAKGRREGNTFILKAIEDERVIQFKLYILGDKYIQLREILEGNQVVQVDFSYLVQK